MGSLGVVARIVGASWQRKPCARAGAVVDHWFARAISWCALVAPTRRVATRYVCACVCARHSARCATEAVWAVAQTGPRPVQGTCQRINLCADVCRHSLLQVSMLTRGGMRIRNRNTLSAMAPELISVRNHTAQDANRSPSTTRCIVCVQRARLEPCQCTTWGNGAMPTTRVRQCLATKKNVARCIPATPNIQTWL